ncbi:protein-export membrane protein, SecD/SecF family [Leptolyngbyaceae cyanobacterium JSC-12]|nr:protein-export membrane protein, SecD/SecF family [Leptolyngbyaceae cyanobacterium JSC-12]
MGRQRLLLILIAALVAGAIAVIFTLPIQLGLDLRGGSQLTLQVKTTEKKQEITQDDLNAVLKVIEGRVNELGVSESLVVPAGKDQILVQLPGVSDPQEAERILGGTAQLDFRRELPKPEVKTQISVRMQELAALEAKQAELKQAGDTAAIAANQAAIQEKQKQLTALYDQLYEKTGLTGDNLNNAGTQPASSVSNDWNVTLQFDSEGAKLFADLTKSLAGTGRTLGIFLDNRLISSPIVGVEHAQTGITGGNAVIQGNFTAQSANELAIQLRGGSLPFPVEIVENRTVGATLGRDSIQRSIYAAMGGLFLVLVFMVLYYRLPGAIADIALIIYATLTLAVFILLGVTLTLPGIAGFILSIGMAVDANVLIFERTREELRAGKSLYRSVESGFYRAFSSILDSNVTTVIACLALFFLGAGLVKGFALTLGIGVVISMFTAVTCSRTLMLYAISFPGLRKPEYFCPSLKGTKVEA